MTEATLRQALAKTLRTGLPRMVVLRHEDRYSAGHPDISVWGSVTIALEVKFSRRGEIRSREVQDLFMLELQAATHQAFYVIYLESTALTFITRPSELKEFQQRTPEVRIAPGFNHKFVTEFVLRSQS